MNVKAISTYINSNKIFVTFTDQTKKFAYIPSSNEFWEYVNQQQLLGNNIEISVDGNSSSGTLGATFSLISSILMIGYMSFMIRKATGAGNFKFKAETTDVRFSDVAGINEEREQLSEVVNFLKEPEKYT